MAIWRWRCRFESGVVISLSELLLVALLLGVALASENCLVYASRVVDTSRAKVSASAALRFCLRVNF